MSFMWASMDVVWRHVREASVAFRRKESHTAIASLEQAHDILARFHKENRDKVADTGLALDWLLGCGDAVARRGWR
jgi:hypothetical protein